MPRADKGRNRAEWVDVPCAGPGCDKRVRRRKSAMKPVMFHSRACYHRYMEHALVRLRRYEILFGPLPDDNPANDA